MPSEGWTWKLTPVALDQFEALDHQVQSRVVSTLDEVVNSGWRKPVD